MANKEQLQKVVDKRQVELDNAKEALTAAKKALADFEEDE